MDDLKVLESELVPVYETTTGEKVVYGKDLHKELEVKTDFSTWIKRRFNECDAQEKADYDLLPKIEEQVSGAKHSIDYIIKLNIAKEMAMLERNEKGKQVRRYFIEVEKRYKESMSELTKEDKLILSIVNGKSGLERVQALSEYKQFITVPLIETIDKQNKTIEKQNIDNKALSGELLDWADRDRINAGIRKLAAATGIRFGDMYKELYKNIEYSHKIYLKSRMERDKNKKKNASYLDYVRDNEWVKILKTFCAMCEAYGKSPKDMMQQTTPKSELSVADDCSDDDKYAWLDNM